MSGWFVPAWVRKTGGDRGTLTIYDVFDVISRRYVAIRSANVRIFAERKATYLRISRVTYKQNPCYVDATDDLNRRRRKSHKIMGSSIGTELGSGTVFNSTE